MNGIKDWFEGLSKQDKQLFLARAGHNLTVFARQASKFKELAAMNEIHYQIYQAISDIGTDRDFFNVDTLWRVLNEKAKQERLDTVLHQAFQMSKDIMVMVGQIG